MDILADCVDRMACGKCGRVLDVSRQKPFTPVDCPDCGTRQNVPALFGQFLLIEQLGGGGMGSVYRAVDQALGRFVAIKVMKQALGLDAELVASFLREARAAAALNHPNIVQIYSCGQEKGQPYIVMELVDGGRLDQLMADGKPVDEIRALQVGLNVAEGLRAANEVGLVHGDIKPANILFDKAGTAKVVDFGLAQFVNRQQEMAGVWGTPYYISPERARGGKADHRSDIYSLGATLYHALAAKPPFDGKTAADVVVARLKRPPPDVRSANDAIHRKTADLLLRMMASDPAVRYPTSASLLADLREALEDAQVVRAPTQRIPKKQEKSPHLVVAVVAGIALLALVVLAAVGIRGASRRDEAPPPPPGPAPATQEVSAAAGGAEALPPDDNLDPRKVVFFKKEAEEQIVAAATALASDRPLAMLEQLDAVAAKIPPNSARAMWLKVLGVLPLWLEGKKLDASMRLDDVSRVSIAIKNVYHPVYMPKVAARYLLGDLPPEKLAAVEGKWPEWFGDLLALYDGVQALVRGDAKAARIALGKYSEGGRTEPAWVYGMRPAAQTWSDQIDALDRLREGAATRIEGGQGAAVRADLEALSKSCVPSLRKPVADEIQRVREAEQTVASKRKGDEAKAREDEAKEAVKAEQARVDEAAEQNKELVRRKEFARAVQALSGLEAALETEAGRDALKRHTDRLARMEELKQLIIASVERDPFRRASGSDLGDVMEAGPGGLRVLILGKGLVQVPWDQVGAVSMGRMAHYYASRVRNPDKRADLMLSLAVYCHVNGLKDPAAKYAAEAVKQNARLTDAAKRLMPGVLPAGGP
jgi:hypothetical protein